MAVNENGQRQQDVHDANRLQNDDRQSFIQSDPHGLRLVRRARRGASDRTITPRDRPEETRLVLANMLTRSQTASRVAGGGFHAAGTFRTPKHCQTT